MEILKTPNSAGKTRIKFLALVICVLTCTVGFSKNGYAQQGTQMVRLAKIKVDPAQLEQYNTALKEQMSAAIRVEPGVLTYYAVADKSDPSNITILEIYADSAAYKVHITTPHFKQYKDRVKDMVRSLELVDVTLIANARKPYQ